MREVHEYNLERARELKMTLDEYHKMMSEKGKQNGLTTDTTQPTQSIVYNSADYVLSYLFPKDTAKKRNKR